MAFRLLWEFGKRERESTLCTQLPHLYRTKYRRISNTSYFGNSLVIFVSACGKPVLATDRWKIVIPKQTHACTNPNDESTMKNFRHEEKSLQNCGMWVMMSGRHQWVGKLKLLDDQVFKRRVCWSKIRMQKTRALPQRNQGQNEWNINFISCFSVLLVVDNVDCWFSFCKRGHLQIFCKGQNVTFAVVV